MKDLLNQLRQQHQTILEMLDKPEMASELVHFVEEVHHPMEEDQLFPLIHQQKFLSQGGPRCTHFMGMRLELNPLGAVRKHIDSFLEKTTFRPTPYRTLPWLSPQSPLSIPFEEHVIGAELGQCLTFLLKPENKKLHTDFFSTLYGDYVRLLKMHIDKEDNCLFIMCERSLD